MELHRPPVLPEVAHVSTPVLWRWLVPLMVDWGVIVGVFFVVLNVNVWWLYILGMAVIGSRQHALTILGHDGAHGSITKNLPLNDLLTSIFCFWPMGASLKAYREYHFIHHHSVGTIEDPELMGKYWSGPHWDLPVSRLRIIGNFLLDVLGIGILIYKWRYISEKCFHKWFWCTQRVHRTGIHSQWVFLAIISAGCVYIDLWQIPLIWFLSMVTWGFAFFRLRIWTEHLGTFGTHRLHPNWWQRLLLLPHNTWLHFEHHRWSSVPFWNLTHARTLDTNTPVITLGQLFTELSTTQPIASGALPDGTFPKEVGYSLWQE